jgi:hypothetical protein
MTMKSKTGAKLPTRRPAAAKAGRNGPPSQFKRKALDASRRAKRKANGAASRGAHPETTSGRKFGPQSDRWLSQGYLPWHNDETK